MRDPYKIIVWGPGRIGSHAIWEIAHNPAFELVGVRCYSEAKRGVDAGELVGIEPMGVRCTDDIAALLEIDCDCVLHTAHEDMNFATDEDILRLLSAGKNLVTLLPYQNAHMFREPEFIAQLETACREGNSTFYADGIDPHLVSNRILLGLTGACADLKSIKLQEHWDCINAGANALKYIGFGIEPADAEKITFTHAVPAAFQKGILGSAETVLGVKFDRIEEIHEYVPASVDIHKPFDISPGQVGRITHRMEGYVDAISPEPFFTHEYHWLIGDDMLPAGVQPGQNYLAIIEGRPSLKMALDFSVSNYSDERFFKLGNMDVEPAYVATVVPCIQSIPHVVAAPTGIMPSKNPSLHWMQDLRDAIG